MAIFDNLKAAFGFNIPETQKTDEKKENLPSPVPPTSDDGAGYVVATGSHYAHYVDIDGNVDARDHYQLIRKYRGISMHPDVDMAIEDIVNEAIINTEDDASISINLDNVEEMSESIKKKVTDEFDAVVSMLQFRTLGHDMFRSWYVDGRQCHHLVVDPNNQAAGIQDIRYLDSTKMRKIREVKYKKDPATGVKLVDKIDEYFLYDEKPGSTNTASVRFSVDAISYVTSGLLDETRKRVISYLHKAIKPVNQLRMMEDSLVIYRLARAPERRIFYIDVGNMRTGAADRYMKEIQNRYRNKLVYDASTGLLRDDRKHMSMLEDFWLPRKEGGRGTEISTLPGGENLGQIEDIIYFQKRLYRSLNVPINRLEQEAQFSLGRSSEITRDEVKFQKFIDRLRVRYSMLFLGITKKQCMLKGICTEEDWEAWADSMNVDYLRDNHFTELQEMEIQRERFATVDQAQSSLEQQIVSKEWVQRNVLKLNDEQLKEMEKQLAAQPQPEEGM